jgi:hypothetical protein
MKCNIDAKGRAVRMVTGLLCCVLGIVVMTLAFILSGAFWPLLAAGLCLLAAGLFQIYESRRGWCALRAVGIKTPL